MSSRVPRPCLPHRRRSAAASRRCRLRRAGALALVLAWTWGASLGSAHATSKVLFVGNSYTFFNAPNDLKGVVKALLDEATAGQSPPGAATVHEVTAGGYQLHQHAKDAATPGTPLHQALSQPWDVVVLQEQSQIPAFKQFGSPVYATSLKSFLALDDLAEASGAHTVALLTWGRRDGDKQNPALGTYKGMQKALAEGTLNYAKQASTAKRPVYVAPAGLAFEKIYDDIVAQGGQPAAAGSVFVRLYSGDGSHPSGLGTFLAGLVVARTLAGVDVTTLTWKPAGVSDADAKVLRAAAQAVVSLGPWQQGGGSGGDGGATDAGAPDAGTPDAGTPDAGTPDAGTPDAGTPDAGPVDTATADAATADAGEPAADAAKPDAGEPAADAAASDDAPRASEVDAGATDTAGGPGATAPPPSAGDDSGCAAHSGAPGRGATELPWVLLGAAWVVLARRRSPGPEVRP